MEHNKDCDTGERGWKEGEIECGKQLTEGQNSPFFTLRRSKLSIFSLSEGQNSPFFTFRRPKLPLLFTLREG